MVKNFLHGIWFAGMPYGVSAQQMQKKYKFVLM